ncbi:MAG: sigma-70 family RNA polymerase sigma factor [Gammaproteobacteria bacterium]|nr:sigma-70 family RNA polymerase sigma factor [Gammaproteobacteria bacterium]
MRFLVRRQDIEDVVQDTFLKAYESEKKQVITSPKSYLFKIAKNIALNELSKKANQLMDYMGDMEELNVIDNRLYGERELEVRQRLVAFNKAIEALPPQCQRVFIMRKIFGFSHKEIAQRLNITVKTVEKHLTKGLARCQAALQSDDDREQGDDTLTEMEKPAGRNMALRRGTDE